MRGLVIPKMLCKITLFTATSGTKSTWAFPEEQSMGNLRSANNVNAKLFQDLPYTPEVPANEFKLFLFSINGITAIDAFAHII